LVVLWEKSLQVKGSLIQKVIYKLYIPTLSNIRVYPYIPYN
jgi:hypothetical protein